MWDLWASEDLNFTRQAVWKHFFFFYSLKQIPIYFSFWRTGECCNRSFIGLIIWLTKMYK